jgi:uncharacterized phiE125 gp8 family phage protein
VRVDEIGCAWTVTVAPTLEPITLDEAKRQARITDTSSDAVLESYIATAREAAEAYMNRGILTQTVKAVFDDFANVMPLPLAAPLQSISHVKYYDNDGVIQTLAASVYDTDTVVRPGAVCLKVGQSWPALQGDRRNGRVEITYLVGWATAALVPEQIKQGIRMYVTYLDLDRDGMEVGAQNARMAAERCWSDRISWTPPRYGW